MTDICKTPFGTWAQPMRDAGFWPRPSTGKACYVKGWSTPDPELDPSVLQGWSSTNAKDNIGLLMGSPLPDGMLLGGLDIDHDDYMNLGRTLLKDPPCGRIGKKGAVFFFRYSPSMKFYKDLRIQKTTRCGYDGSYAEKYKKVGELLTTGMCCIIPPSIHPETNQPYRWIGTPLHEIDFNLLPIIGE